MDAIIFIGTRKSGSSREAIKAAKQLGYNTILLTNLAKQFNQKDEYDDVDLMIYCKFDMDKMLGKINEIQKLYTIKAIISFIDPYCITAAQLSEILGLNHFTLDAITLMQNKYQSRNALKDTNYIPKYKKIRIDDSISKEDIPLPAIVKYPESQGSKDVYLVNTYDEFTKTTKKLMNLYDNQPIIVEEFLNGQQYIVETLVIDGVIHIIAVVEQEIDYINGHFIITGYHLLLDLEKSFYEALKEAVEEIIRGHGLINGPSHLEMRLVNHNWKLIEINPRISGASMNRMLEIGLGINLVKETLKFSLNEDIELEPKKKVYTSVKYIVVDRKGKLERITGRNRALNCKGVKEIYIKPKRGSILTPPISMGNRYAYVIATGDSEEDAKNNAQYAASKITFHLSDIE